MLTRRSVIRANQLQHAADWIVRRSEPQPAAAPLLQGWVVIATCDTIEDAAVLALAVRGRSAWCITDDNTTWYLVETGDSDIDRCAEIAFATDALNQFGLHDRCEVIDAVVVDVAFRSEREASAFEVMAASGRFA